MQFEAQTLYHVYNQGNNRRTLFHSPTAYLLFREKLQRQVLPFADLLSYCLMPNHFHLQLIPNAAGLALSKSKVPTKKVASDSAFISITNLSEAFRRLLMGYTRSYNKHFQCSGSLFRQHTKAKELSSISQSRQLEQLTAGRNCLHYIHENPLKANLSVHASEWGYSSYLEYSQHIAPEHRLCNIELGYQLFQLQPTDFE